MAQEPLSIQSETTFRVSMQIKNQILQLVLTEAQCPEMSPHIASIFINIKCKTYLFISSNWLPETAWSKSLSLRWAAKAIYIAN